MPRTYLALVHQDDADGPFGVSFPELPGCVGLGDTLEDALASGRDALAFHLEGEPAPPAPAGGFHAAWRLE